MGACQTCCGLCAPKYQPVPSQEDKRLGKDRSLSPENLARREQDMVAFDEHVASGTAEPITYAFTLMRLAPLDPNRRSFPAAKLPEPEYRWDFKFLLPTFGVEEGLSNVVEFTVFADKRANSNWFAGPGEEPLSIPQGDVPQLVRAVLKKHATDAMSMAMRRHRLRHISEVALPLQKPTKARSAVVL